MSEKLIMANDEYIKSVAGYIVDLGLDFNWFMQNTLELQDKLLDLEFKK